MTVVRYYRMEAIDGQAERLSSALAALGDMLKPIPGFLGFDLLRDREQPNRYVFMEKWASVDMHKAGAALLPKDAFAPVMEVLAGKPEAAWLESVSGD